MRGRDIALVLGAVVLVMLLLGLLGGGMMGPGMMGGSWGAYGYNPWMGVVPLLFWALIIGGVVLLAMALVRRDRTPDPGIGPGPGSSALDILRDRYARGEIAREQYEQMRRDLEEKRN